MDAAYIALPMALTPSLDLSPLVALVQSGECSYDIEDRTAGTKPRVRDGTLRTEYTLFAGYHRYIRVVVPQPFALFNFKRSTSGRVANMTRFGLGQVKSMGIKPPQVGDDAANISASRP